MASQIYARYVPPKKDHIATSLMIAGATTTASASSANPLDSTPPSTKHDASSTYARYIPSRRKPLSVPEIGIPHEGIESPAVAVSKRKREELTEDPTTKKAKKHKKDKKDKDLVEIALPANESESLLESIHVDAKPPKKKSKKTKNVNVVAENEIASSLAVVPASQETTDSIEDEPLNVSHDKEDSKHRRLMEKRENSLKKAEKISKKATSKAAAEVQGSDNTAIELTAGEPEELHALVPLPQPEPILEAPIEPTSASLPPWLASPIRVSPTTLAAFSDVGVEDDVAVALHTKGFEGAFAVQAAVLPLLLPGPSQSIGDIVVSAATGSGKTLAYVLPMIENIRHNTVTRLRGLIVMPTRELVVQAREVCEICATAFSGTGGKRLKIGTAVGNETFKAEQASLMDQELQYNPAGYRDQLRRLNAKWESSDQGSDEEDDILCDEEPVPALPDHVINAVSRVDILICTPGRLVEHLKSTPGFSLEYVKWLVIDEADKLLDQSFQQWLDIVMARLGSKTPSFSTPNYGRVRKVVLSATMTRDIGQLNSLKLHRPKMVVLEDSSYDGLETTDASHAHVLPALLVESAVKTDDETLKPLYLMELMRRENMIHSLSSLQSSSEEDLSNAGRDSSSEESSSDDGSSMVSNSSMGSESPNTEQIIPREDVSRGILIFTKSNETAVRLGRLIGLLQPSYSAAIGTLTSTTSTSSRRKTIHSFNAGKLSILVASDLVSRGLDLPNLAHVVNYDMPTSITNYIHRVGRTARAGRQGWSWTMFTPIEGRWFWNEIARSQIIARQAGAKISRVNIDAESFGNDMRGIYETALEELGQEARTSKLNKSKHKVGRLEV